MRAERANKSAVDRPGRWLRGGLYVLLMLASCSVSGVAAAQSGRRLALLVEPCPGEGSAVDVEELLSIAASELSPLNLERVTRPDPHRPTLALTSCEGERVTLRWLAHSTPARSMELVLDQLAGETRTRTVALALAEFALESARTESTSSAPTTTTSRRDAIPATASEESNPKARLLATTTAVGAEARTFVAPYASVYGPRLHVQRGRVRLGVSTLLGRAQLTRREIHIGLALASAGYDLWQAADLVALTAAAELGFTWVWGDSAERGERSTRGDVAAAVLLGVALRGSFGRWLSLEALLSGGFTYGLIARPGSSVIESTHAPCVGLSLAFGYRHEASAGSDATTRPMRASPPILPP